MNHHDSDPTHPPFPQTRSLRRVRNGHPRQFKFCRTMQGANYLTRMTHSFLVPIRYRKSHVRKRVPHRGAFGGKEVEKENQRCHISPRVCGARTLWLDDDKLFISAALSQQQQQQQ